MKTKIVKFGLNDLMNAGMALVVLGIAISFGASVMTDVKSGFCASGYRYNATSGVCCGSKVCNVSTQGGYTAEFNATRSGIKGVSVIPAKMETLATIVVASVIIGVLVNFLWARFR